MRHEITKFDDYTGTLCMVSVCGIPLTLFTMIPFLCVFCFREPPMFSSSLHPKFATIPTSYILNFRVKANIAKRLGVTADKVKNAIIWGNHSSTQFPDVKCATVELQGKVTAVCDAIKDVDWIENDFIKVRHRLLNSIYLFFQPRIRS